MDTDRNSSSIVRFDSVPFSSVQLSSFYLVRCFFLWDCSMISVSVRLLTSLLLLLFAIILLLDELLLLLLYYCCSFLSSWWLWLSLLFASRCNCICWYAYGKYWRNNRSDIVYPSDWIINITTDRQSVNQSEWIGRVCITYQMVVYTDWLTIQHHVVNRFYP